MRWLTVVVGVGIAAAALHALLARPPAPRSAPAVPPVSSRPAADEIGERSRAQLERVLREAEAREERR